MVYTNSLDPTHHTISIWAWAQCGKASDMLERGGSRTQRVAGVLRTDQRDFVQTSCGQMLNIGGKLLPCANRNRLCALEQSAVHRQDRP